MARNISVMGIYADRTTVSDAISVLTKTGYRATDISVLSSDNQGSKDFAIEKRSRAWQGAAIGALLGAMCAAALTWLVSLHPQILANIKSLVAARPVATAVAGAGALGALLGCLGGLVAGLRLTDYVAKRFAGRIRRGGILLSVHCDSQEWSDRAMKTLKDTGARNISSAAEGAADFGTSDKPTERAPVPAPVIVEAVVPVATESVSADTKG
jgi:hypothetical protein